jgi:hypothetical protein
MVKQNKRPDRNAVRAFCLAEFAARTPQIKFNHFFWRHARQKKYRSVHKRARFARALQWTAI